MRVCRDVPKNVNLEKLHNFCIENNLSLEINNGKAKVVYMEIRIDENYNNDMEMRK